MQGDDQAEMEVNNALENIREKVVEIKKIER